MNNTTKIIAGIAAVAAIGGLAYAGYNYWTASKEEEESKKEDKPEAAKDSAKEAVDEAKEELNKAKEELEKAKAKMEFIKKVKEAVKSLDIPHIADADEIFEKVYTEILDKNPGVYTQEVLESIIESFKAKAAEIATSAEGIEARAANVVLTTALKWNLAEKELRDEYLKKGLDEETIDKVTSEITLDDIGVDMKNITLADVIKLEKTDFVAQITKDLKKTLEKALNEKKLKGGK
nr:MAG TPA: ATPase [Caudoviricetes sp.]